MRQLLIGLLLISFAVTVQAGGDKPGSVVEVKIKNHKFEPQTITVKRGTTVRWINEEKRQYHSVWFEQAGDEEPDYFFPEESTDKTFNKPGKYPYRCGPHEKMKGMVIVE